MFEEKYRKNVVIISNNDLCMFTTLILFSPLCVQSLKQCQIRKNMRNEAIMQLLPLMATLELVKTGWNQLQGSAAASIPV